MEVALQHLLSMPGDESHRTVACVNHFCYAEAMAAAPRLLVKLPALEPRGSSGVHNGCITDMQKLPSIHARMQRATELRTQLCIPSGALCMRQWRWYTDVAPSETLAMRMTAEYDSSMVAAGVVLSSVTKFTSLTGWVPLPHLAEYAPNITHAHLASSADLEVAAETVASLQGLRSLSSLTVQCCTLSPDVGLDQLTGITHMCLGVNMPRSLSLGRAVQAAEQGASVTVVIMGPGRLPAGVAAAYAPLVDSLSANMQRIRILSLVNMPGAARLAYVGVLHRLQRLDLVIAQLSLHQLGALVGGLSMLRKLAVGSIQQVQAGAPPPLVSATVTSFGFLQRLSNECRPLEHLLDAFPNLTELLFQPEQKLALHLGEAARWGPLLMQLDHLGACACFIGGMYEGDDVAPFAVAPGHLQLPAGHMQHISAPPPTELFALDRHL